MLILLAGYFKIVNKIDFKIIKVIIINFNLAIIRDIVSKVINYLAITSNLNLVVLVILLLFNINFIF